MRAGISDPLGFAHAFGGGSNGLGQRLILNFHSAPTEQNGAGADAAQFVVPKALGNVIQPALRVRALFSRAHHHEQLFLRDERRLRAVRQSGHQRFHFENFAVFDAESFADVHAEGPFAGAGLQHITSIADRRRP
jgi:hypothetical protein